MKKITSAFFIILIITSCEKTINVNIPNHQPKLFVDGVVQSGDIFKVKVGKVVSILAVRDSNTYKVDNALVHLYVNNVIKDTLIYNARSNNYIAKNGTVSSSGNIYLLKAAATGYVTVEAETTAPATTLIQKITRREKLKKDATGKDMDEVKITFQDNGNEQNYYLLKLLEPIFEVGDSVFYVNMYKIISGDADIDRSTIMDPTTIDNFIKPPFYMTDKNFNGQVKEITLYILSELLSPLQHTITNKTYKPIVELHSLTYNHYRYLKSQGSYIDNKENPFSEPSVVYSNVINGYGIFTSFNLARDTIR